MNATRNSRSSNRATPASRSRRPAPTSPAPRALNVVTGLGEEAGAALTSHAGIDFVTFTGSPDVGKLVQKAAGERLIKCVLKLGGKSPQIVFADADLNRTDEEEAIRLANATDFGLLAGIWTRDGARQIRMARRMHCGQVYLSCYGAGGGVELPFGGVKKSGHGREKGFLALEEFCVLKTVVQFHGE